MYKLNFVKSVLLIAIGGILGVFFSQFSYFEIEKSISLGDLIIFLLTSFVAIYIADDIARRLSKVQTVKTLYQDDIKSFITYLSKIEEWVDVGILPAGELRAYLKKGTIRINSIIKIYNSNNEIITHSLIIIRNNFNQFKSEITGLNTSHGGQVIELNFADKNKFREIVEDLKNDLLNAIIHC